VPIPSPGSLIIDFRALGKWYRMRDNGAGLIEGQDPAIGTGSVDYVTGAVIITLGAIPDVDSSVIFTWGTLAHYTIRAGATANAGTTMDLRYTLQNVPVVPGSVSIAYPVNSVQRTATDSGGAGNISGTGVTGTVDYTTGEVVLRFSTPPDVGSLLSNAYSWKDGDDLIGTLESAPVSGGTIDLSVLAPYIGAGTLTFNLANGSQLTGYLASGGSVTVPQAKVGNRFYKTTTVGVHNSTTGIVTITNPVNFDQAEWNGITGTWNVVGTGTEAIVSASNIQVQSDTSAFTPNAVTGEQISPSAVGLTMDLTTTVADSVIPWSLMMTATGKTYVDRNGILYADVSMATGAGAIAGSIDYATGVCTFTFWGNNAAVSRQVLALLTTFGDWTASAMFFRTAGSPIRPASLYVQASATNGELITGTADTNGVISGAKMRGTVQQDMGVIAVEFGTQGVEWQPLEILPGTIRYNAVLQTNLPLDAALLGLDPVRLPSDGRVPIYRPADIVVIHHTDTTTLANPVAADTVYPIGRTGLAVAVLYDADDQPIPVDRYEVDLLDGEILIPDDWDGLDDEGDPFPQPLYVKHRVEDMSLVSDVQITGQIEISKPLSRDYPVGSYCSSALVYGDLFAHVTNVFDQATWSGVWSNALIGSQATAQYDDINYPIEVLNQSAVTDRWRINFTSTTAFQVISENVGVVATGTTGTDTAPINPVTGAAYFVIRAAGWGSGWAAGNQLRFNVVGASGPTWIARTILAGATLEGDQFNMEVRGDVD